MFFNYEKIIIERTWIDVDIDSANSNYHHCFLLITNVSLP